LVTEYGEKRDQPLVVYGGCLLVVVVAVVGSILVAGGTGLLPNGSHI
jgi:hypothetical protein